MHAIQGTAVENNGTWDRVKCMFKENNCDDDDDDGSGALPTGNISHVILIVLLTFVINFK